MKSYIKIEWNHDYLEEPILIYTELNKERYEIRKVEIFRDNSIGYANNEFSVNGTSLGLQQFPQIEDYNTWNSQNESDWDEEIIAYEISEISFNMIWIKATK